MRRQPLTEKSDSQSNTVRLIESTPPPRLPTQQQSTVEQRRSLFEQQFSPSSSVFPTLPSQILPPPVSNTTHLFQGQGTALQDDVSPLARTTKPQASRRSSASNSATTTHQPPSNSISPSGQRPKTPRSAKKLKQVAVRADKTFSVLDLASLDTSQYPSDWQRTPSRSSNLKATESPHERLSSYPIENESPTKSPGSCTEPGTPATTPIPVTPKQTEKSLPSDVNKPQPAPPPPPPNQEDPERVGGIRVVPKTPDSKKEDGPLPVTRIPDLPSQPTSSDQAPAASTTSPILITKSSDISAISGTPSDAGNYVVFGHQSSSASETSTVIRHPIYPTSPADSGNYQIIEQDEDDSPYDYNSIHDPTTSNNSNYEVHNLSSGEVSPSTSSVGLLPVPSQDSLVVPPLRPKGPRGRRSHEKFGYYKSRSRESLRTASSLASISSVLEQEATRVVFGSAAVIQNIPPPSSFAIPGSWAEQALSRRDHMQAHPHQWSSQLSTVLSESDGATDRGSGNFSSGRRSSGFMSSASRQYRGSGGSYNSLERPQPAYARGTRDVTGSTIRIVGDEDEDGDHLTDMQDLRARPSRSRSGLSFFSSSSSDNGRRNSIQSTTSSRANSLLASTIPTWARLYYGSGERRWLAAGAPGSSTEGSVSSRPGSPITPGRTGSPNTDHFPLSIYSPRRRPRDVNPNQNPHSPLRRSLEIRPHHLDSQGNLINDQEGPYARHSRRWRSSSIWSPHLRVDRRATRMSVWEPPSFNWSTEDTWRGRRNVQVVMFVLGFIFPFAWMIAAFLPLPPSTVFAMQEHRGSEYDVEWSPSHPDLTNSAAAQNSRPVDEARYESAKWWRRLNRIMSFIGLLIIGAVIALVILGLHDNWGKSNNSHN